jgi:type IV secretion system protein VirB1
MDIAAFLLLAKSCAPQVASTTAAALVQVESSFNPYAVGVVGAKLSRQPRTAAEARAAVALLETEGRNYSVGLAQINRKNWARLGLNAETAMEPCANLRAMQSILQECFGRAPGTEQARVRRALSCYYSGDFRTGFAHGYVAKVTAASESRVHADDPSAQPDRYDEPKLSRVIATNKPIAGAIR